MRGLAGQMKAAEEVEAEGVPLSPRIATTPAQKLLDAGHAAAATAYGLLASANFGELVLGCIEAKCCK